jgi:phosphoglycolate phosphatase-like HAD superfamily hydrolase
MRLVVFDLDGTLTKTNAVDEGCFVQAFADAGFRDLNTNWMDYDHVTDSGVARQVFIERFGCEPKPAEISNIVEYFVELLRGRHALNPEGFVQTPGAGSLLRKLRENDSQWGVAIATGSWTASARFKMRWAGLDLDGCPAAFAEDGPGREAILQTAVQRAAQSYRQEHFERIVSVGDAAWDVRTAHRLGLPFLGVGDDTRGQRLRCHGASHVIENFMDETRFMHCLNVAEIPDTSRAE